MTTETGNGPKAVCGQFRHWRDTALVVSTANGDPHGGYDGADDKPPKPKSLEPIEEVAFGFCEHGVGVEDERGQEGSSRRGGISDTVGADSEAVDRGGGENGSRPQYGRGEVLVVR